MSYLTFLPFSNCNLPSDLFLVLFLLCEPEEALESQIDQFSVSALTA